MKLGQQLMVNKAIMATYQKAYSVVFTLEKWEEQFLFIATGGQPLVTIFTQPIPRKLGPLLPDVQEIMDMSVKELLAIVSPKLLQEQFPSIATGRVVLVIISTQPMLQRSEQRLLDKWEIMDIAPRVWHAMSFLITDESDHMHVTSL